MKKIIIRTIIFICATLLAFGIGMLIADIRSGKIKKPENISDLNKAISSSVTSEVKNIISGTVGNVSQSNNDIAAGTMPGDNGQTSFSFAVLGDTKVFKANSPNGNLEKAVKSITVDHKDIGFDFVMGDLVSSCDGGSSCEGKFNDWKSVMSPLMPKTYTVVGNHDRTGGDKADAVWQKEFDLPTNGPLGYSELVYSFDFGNSHFAVLDSEKPHENYIDSAQQDWLNKDLSANKKPNIFVFYHEPAFGTSQAKKDGLDAHPTERDAFWNIIIKYHVTAVFNGHEHIHTRKKIGDTYQIVVGDTDSTDDDFPDKSVIDYGYKGKSYMIVSVDGQKINLKLYTVDGNLVNAFDLVR